MSQTVEVFGLAQLGWGADFEQEFEQHAAVGLVPGRVAVQHRGAYDVFTPDGEVRAGLPGRLLHEAGDAADLPAVGDWVALDAPAGNQSTIRAVLPRRTAFVRTMASDQHRLSEQQVVAANVDTVFLVSALVDDYNLRRLERYLVLAWESGAQPAVVLTKADLCADVEGAVAEVEAVAIGVPVHAVSNLTGEGVDELWPYFTGNRTVAALGSSGVGKSSLINRLSGHEVMATGEIRADGRGRHTTTRRELLAVPGGGFFLDTPGMRELQLAEATGGVEEAFDDVTELAALCRFSNCAHESEPGCAVREALQDGRLDRERWESYRKLQRELAMLERKLDARARSEERKKWRRFSKAQRKDSW
ncbi:MAG TPA: ribosome small subunit-dependent GTPase A [Gaiellaceae bacterium]|nr:ribosome small subunit-dependent GTPase A [Gaiellaceae bacterium]